jgi:hypothetical protein
MEKTAPQDGQVKSGESEVWEWGTGLAHLLFRSEKRQFLR